MTKKLLTFLDIAYIIIHIDKNRYDMYREDIMVQNYNYNANVFKAFCDENRLMILEMLQSGEKCACKLLEELNIAQSTLSHHMKILCDSGIVISHRDGKWTYYSINQQGVVDTKKLLEEITTIKINN